MFVILLDASSKENSKQEENVSLTDWILADCRRQWEKVKEVSTSYYIYEVGHRLRILHSYFDWYEQEEIHLLLESQKLQKCLLARKQKIGYN